MTVRRQQQPRAHHNKSCSLPYLLPLHSSLQLLASLLRSRNCPLKDRMLPLRHRDRAWHMPSDLHAWAKMSKTPHPLTSSATNAQKMTPRCCWPQSKTKLSSPQSNYTTGKSFTAKMLLPPSPSRPNAAVSTQSSRHHQSQPRPIKLTHALRPLHTTPPHQLQHPRPLSRLFVPPSSAHRPHRSPILSRKLSRPTAAARPSYPAARPQQCKAGSSQQGRVRRRVEGSRMRILCMVCRRRRSRVVRGGGFVYGLRGLRIWGGEGGGFWDVGMIVGRW